MQRNLFSNIPEDVELPPETIDVLGKKFTVKLLAPDENDDCDGYMELALLQIGLRMQPANEYNQDTLFHELTHAVDEVLHLRMKENQVHQLAAGLMAVLKQNKELAAWLLK